MDNLLGRFVWHELMTPDVEKSVSFYRKVVGWDHRRFEGEGEPYQILMQGEKGVAGVMQMPAGLTAPTHWTGYIGTPSVEETAASAARKGAKVRVEPQIIPDVGRFAVLEDPQGAVFAVFTPAPGQPAGTEKEPVVGEISWNELATTDPEAAFDFYRELFGWERKQAHRMEEGSTYQTFGAGAQTLGGMFPKPKEMAAPPHWLFYVRVADLDGAVSRARGSGGRILREPLTVPTGARIAICTDPQGGAFALHMR